MNNLPREVLARVTRQLKSRELARAAVVCRDWRAALAPLLADVHAVREAPAGVYLLLLPPQRPFLIVPLSCIIYNHLPQGG